MNLNAEINFVESSENKISVEIKNVTKKVKLEGFWFSSLLCFYLSLYYLSNPILSFSIIYFYYIRTILKYKHPKQKKYTCINRSPFIIGDNWLLGFLLLRQKILRNPHKSVLITDKLNIFPAIKLLSIFQVWLNQLLFHLIAIRIHVWLTIFYFVHWKVC